MTHWEYRIVERRNPGGVVWYEIRELCIGDGGEIVDVPNVPSEPAGETIDDLRDDLALMAEALTRPIVRVT